MALFFKGGEFSQIPFSCTFTIGSLTVVKKIISSSRPPEVWEIIEFGCEHYFHKPIIEHIQRHARLENFFSGPYKSTFMELCDPMKY